jgi:hypothetical protein
MRKVMRFSWTRSFKSIALVAACSFVLQAELPDGWTLSSSEPRDYEFGIDSSASYNGEPSTCLKSKNGASPEGYGGMGPSASLVLHPYRGKRVRLTANVKADGVTGWAGLWMRVDGDDDPKNAHSSTVAYDNMQGRPITGTRSWHSYSVVLDVPKKVRGIHVGILLNGNGAVWLNGVRVEVVGKDVPTTGVH